MTDQSSSLRERLFGRRGKVHIRVPSAEGDGRPFTGSCSIREHTGDGAFVGRCWHATYGGFCPRHGAVEDYPHRDDREVSVQDRRLAP